jgi:hypothetical protein
VGRAAAGSGVGIPQRRGLPYRPTGALGLEHRRAEAIRAQTQHPVALGERRPRTPIARTRAIHLKRKAEGLSLELQGRRASVTETLQNGRSGSL